MQIYTGLVEEGLQNLDIAARSDPDYPYNYPYNYLYKSLGLRIKGECGAAVQAANRFPVETFNQYLPLASCYVRLDKPAEAKVAVSKALELFPDLSVSNYREMMAFTDKKFVEEYLEELRRAGLPE